MLKELKCGVFVERPEIEQMLSEDGLVLDVEHADVIEITTAPTALKETIEKSDAIVVELDGDCDAE